jgi:hypothetical protein
MSKQELLNQVQLGSPPDGRPAAVDVELAVSVIVFCGAADASWPDRWLRC